MSQQLEVVKVFIASPGDLSEERELFPGVLQFLNDLFAHRMGHDLKPVGWEDAVPKLGRPQALINADVSECDVFLILLWKRWGTPSGQYSSGTEEEFEIALDRFRKTNSPHVLLYCRSVPQDMMADPGKQLEKVLAFRTRIEVERIGLYKPYDTPEQWKNLLMKHLSDWLFNKVYGKTPAPAVAAPVTAPEVQGLDESKQGLLQLHKEVQESKRETAQPETSESKLRAQAIGDAVKAMEFCEKGMLTLAEQNFARAVSLYEEPEVLNNFGLFLYRIGSLDRATEMFEKVLALGGVGAEETPQAIAYSSLGDVYRTRGELERAQQMYERALEINTRLDRQEGIADSYDNLGVVYRTRGELAKAEQMHERALEINGRLGRREGMAITYRKLGNVYHARGDAREAQEMFERALAIDTELGRKEGMARNHINLGNIYLLGANLDQAEKMYNRALELSKELGRKQGMADAYGSLGSVYKERGNLDRAEEYYLKARDIDTALGRKEGMANAFGNLGIVYLTRGDLVQAEEMHHRALELDLALGSKRGIADDYDNLAQVYLKKDDKRQAAEVWLKAVQIYKDLGNNEEAARLLALVEALKT